MTPKRASTPPFVIEAHRVQDDDEYLTDTAIRVRDEVLIPRETPEEWQARRIAIRKLWQKLPNHTINQILARLHKLERNGDAPLPLDEPEPLEEEQEDEWEPMPEPPHISEGDPDSREYRDKIRDWVKKLFIWNIDYPARKAYRIAVQEAGWPSDEDQEADERNLTRSFRRFCVGPWKWGKIDAKKEMGLDEEPEEEDDEPEPEEPTFTDDPEDVESEVPEVQASKVSGGTIRFPDLAASMADIQIKTPKGAIRIRETDDGTHEVVMSAELQPDDIRTFVKFVTTLLTEDLYL